MVKTIMEKNRMIWMWNETACKGWQTLPSLQQVNRYSKSWKSNTEKTTLSDLYWKMELCRYIAIKKPLRNEVTYLYGSPPTTHFASSNLLSKDAIQKMGSVAWRDIYLLQGKAGYSFARPLSFRGKSILTRQMCLLTGGPQVLPFRNYIPDFQVSI